MFAEDPIELGEAVETTGFRQFGDGDLGINEQCLHISDPCHLNIVCHRETGNLFKFVGKVAGTDTEMAGKRLQRQRLGVVRMNVSGNRVDLHFGLCDFGFVGIYIGFLVQENQDQEFDELLMDDQVTHGVLLLRQMVNVIQLSV